MGSITTTRSRAIAAAICSAAFSIAAQAQTVTGTIDGPLASIAYEHVTFSCNGAPTCTGQYTEDYKPRECSNSLVFTSDFNMTGLNLTLSGSLQGSITMASWDYSYTVRSDGSCAIQTNTLASATFPYTGSYNAATRTGTLLMSISTDAGFQVPGTFSASVTGSAPPPVFPMTVHSNIDAVQATASAVIQFRPQDVGTIGSVYVFAVAPSTRVLGGQNPGVVPMGLAWIDPEKKAAGEKADACVISQLNSSGQLVAVTIAQLQAYLSGTLSASGASVSILNGTPTPNVAGATFYVGYGSTSSSMLNNGIFRNAVLVPGTGVCPMLPSQTALWWNPNESGWGLNLNHQGSTLFGTLFTYDTGRAPLWLVMSGGVMQSDGVTYSGDLYRTTGPAFNAVPFTPIGAANITKVGTMTLTFTDTNVGTLQYTVNGVAVTKAIQRQVYGTRAANCLPTSDSRVFSTNYQDLWWNPTESGWGLNVTHQDSTLFATLFTYDPSGRDLWLVMSAGVRQGDGSYLGDLYRTAGPAFNTTPFTGVTVATVGTMRLRFSDGNTGTLTYTYNGTTVTKNMQRQVFSSPVSACN